MPGIALASHPFSMNDANKRRLGMKDNKSSTIALSQIATLEQALDEAPARSTTEVGKGKAIGILAPKLYALRAKGYTWRDVAAWLTDHDVAVTPAALQRYLREGKIAAAKRDKVGAKTRREGASRDGVPGTATVDSKAARPNCDQTALRPLCSPPTRAQRVPLAPPTPRGSSFHGRIPKTYETLTLHPARQTRLRERAGLERSEKTAGRATWHPAASIAEEPVSIRPLRTEGSRRLARRRASG
jgi:hypothetical protein